MVQFYFILCFVLGALWILLIIALVYFIKKDNYEQSNKVHSCFTERNQGNDVHFYVVRSKLTRKLVLFLGQPTKNENSGNWTDNINCATVCSELEFKKFGLSPKDYSRIIEDHEPIEVFLKSN